MYLTRFARLRPVLRTASLAAVIAAGLAAPVGSSTAQAQATDLLKKLNAPYARVAGTAKSADKIFTAYLDMTKPPAAIGDDFNQTTIYPGMDGFADWAKWAEANVGVGKALIDCQNLQVLGVPYGTDGVDPKFVERGLVIEVGAGGDLTDVRFPYLKALEAISAYVAADMYRLCEAGSFDEAFTVGLAHLRVMRQACDAQMYEEKLAAMTMLADAFSVHRDVLYTYQDKLPLELLKKLSLKEYPFLKTSDTERLKRIEMPEGDLYVAEAIIDAVFGADGQVADDRFKKTFAAMQAESQPLTGFGASKRWERIAGVHGSRDASTQKLNAIYDDWWRRWRLPAYGTMMAAPTVLSKTNPVKYAAVVLSVADMDELFQMRRRLIAEFCGTVCAAGILSYQKDLGVWPDDIKKAYTQFFPKRFNFDPYDKEYGQLRFDSLGTRDRGIESEFGRVNATGCVLYARNDDNQFSGATRHAAGGASDDFVLWPALRAASRMQGK
jgi:hypothetical protein